MKLISALLLVSISAHAAPILKAVERYQADGSLMSQPVTTQGPKGEKLTVAIEQSSPDDRLTARNEAGVKVADIAVYKSTSTERVSVLDAHLNVKGELIAITELTDTGVTGGSRLYADNMTTGFSVNLTQVTQYPELVTRTTFNGKNLLAIEIDLGEGEAGQRPSLLRIVDESNGQVLKDILTKSIIEGRFIKNAQGRLQLITTGYDVFDLIDIESGLKTDLLPARTKPQAGPHFVKTSIGELIQLSDQGLTQLYDVQSLANARPKVVRAYKADDVEISSDGLYAIEKTLTEIRIRAIATNQRIGAPLPRHPQATEGTFQGRDLGALVGLLITKTEKVAVIAQAIQPDSYMPGTALTYFDLETGKVLRMRRLKLYQVTPQLLVNEKGVLISIERSFSFTQVPDTIINVRSNTVEQSLANDYRHVYVQARSGSIALAHQNETGGKLCLAFIDSLNDETCINDQLITKDSIYGVESTRGRMSVSLDGNLGKQIFSIE